MTYTLQIDELLKYLDVSKEKDDAQDIPSQGSDHTMFNSVLGEELALMLYEHFLKNENIVKPHGKNKYAAQQVSILVAENKQLDGKVMSDGKPFALCEVKSWACASGNYKLPANSSKADELYRGFLNARRALLAWTNNMEQIFKVTYPSKKRVWNGKSTIRVILFWRPIYWDDDCRNWEYWWESWNNETNKYVQILPKRVYDLLQAPLRGNVQYVNDAIERAFRTEVGGEDWEETQCKYYFYWQMPTNVLKRAKSVSERRDAKCIMNRVYVFSASMYLRYLKRRFQIGTVDLTLKGYDEHRKTIERLFHHEDYNNNQP